MSMVIEWQRDETIAVVSMNNGENRHNLEFARKMLSVLDEIVADESIDGMVLTSGDPKYWSVGVDVEWATGCAAKGDLLSVKDFFYAINSVFKQMLTYPVPIIASINGHAAANGLVLACACDFRFMRNDRGFCRFPEVNLGIPFLPGMIEITKKGIPYYKFEELKYTGKKATAAEMEEHHAILKSFDNEATLMRESLAFARSFKKGRAIFGEMKRRMHRGIIRTIDEEDPEYIESIGEIQASMT
jgi:enoyl-CoA hydratase/carnithine racemase